MNHAMHTPRRLLLAAALCAAMPTAALAQAWPTAKPITLIVPYTAGGSVDVNARLVAQRLGERLKQSVVIDNVSGAGGAIGVAKAVNATPDGYTLVVGPDSAIAIGKLVNPTAFRFDPLKDLAPVGLLNTAPMVLVARPGLEAQTFADFVKLAKAKPGQYNYATSGVGTVLQLAMELLSRPVADVGLEHAVLEVLAVHHGLGDVVEADHAHQHALVHHRHVARVALEHHAAHFVELGFHGAGERVVVHHAVRTVVVPTTCRRWRRWHWITSRKVSMPTRSPCSMTTSEPMSFRPWPRRLRQRLVGRDGEERAALDAQDVADFHGVSFGRHLAARAGFGSI
jgi:hypothetical protein